MTWTGFRNSVVSVLSIVVLLLLGLLWTSPVSAQGTDSNADGAVDGEIVVKLDLTKLSPTETCETTIQEIAATSKTVKKGVLLSNQNVACIYLLEALPGTDTQVAIDEIKADTRVKYAEPNYTTDAPEDSRYMRSNGDSSPAPSSDSTSYSGQYAVEALNLPGAHSVEKGDGTTVAVLDTGVQLDHPELAGSLVQKNSQGEQGYDFIGDDGDPSEQPNGIDDDSDCPTNPCTDPSYIDEATGHGTHVAGIVHLTAPDAKIMPLRVLDSDGTGNIFVIAEAVQYAVLGPDKQPNTGDEADVINMSLSSSQPSKLVQDVSDDLDAVEENDDDDTGPALTGVPTEGAVVVAAAGNDGAEQPAYPAAETGVIGVASVDKEGKKSDFSNYFGSPQVDISAPGDDIHSTFTGGGYAEWDGTSMAAPFVAGQAALIRSVKQGLPSTAPSGQPSVTEYITTTARPIDAQNQNQPHSGKLGAGHADACASVKALLPDTTCSTAEPQPNTPPVIWDPRPVPGSATRDRTPVIAAKISDAQTDLAKSNVRLFLDGRERGMFSYDNAENNRLIFASGRLGYGGHRAIILAEDPEGLVTKKAWSFRVVR